MLPRQAILPVVFAKESADSRLLNGHGWSDLMVNGNDPSKGFLRGDKIQPVSITGSQIAAATISGSNLANAIIEAVHLSPQLVQDAIHPSGTVIAWMGTATNPPPGWEFCWGQVMGRNDPKYARLFSVIGTSNGTGTNSSTFSLPDLRGMFLRGVNGSRADGFADPNVTSRVVPSGNSSFTNAVGSVESDAFQGHAHEFYFTVAAASGGGSSVNPTVFKYTAQLPLDTVQQEMVRSPTTRDGFGQVRTAVETRPKNVYVQYLIKL
jgi:uncharacterized protein YjbI with pentapeptide repeats